MYSEFYFGNVYLDLACWAGYNRFHNQRHVFFPGFDATASSKYSGVQIDPHGEIGYDFHVKCFTIEPFIALDWAMDFVDGYAEEGAGLFDMTQKRRFSSMRRINTGFNFYQTVDRGTNIWLLRETISYINEKPFNVGKVTSTIAGAPTSFTVLSFTKPLNLISPAAEIYWGHRNGLFLSVNYEGEFGSGYRSNQVYGKIGVHF